MNRKIPTIELGTSRMYSSEEALSELGCEHIKSVENARVLVGGLGMGFTLAAALKATTDSSEVVVAELVPGVVEWLSCLRKRLQVLMRFY